MQDNYRDLFFPESQEYLKIVNGCLVKLESNPADLDSINEIFRCIHTLKGMSATMGYDKLTRLSHRMEDLLDEARKQTKKIDSKIIDVLFACVDNLEQLLQDTISNKDSRIDILVCINRINEFLPKEKAMAEGGLSVSEQAFELGRKDLNAIKELRNKNFNIFKIKIIIAKDCVMKQARAYLVITNLKRIGEIIKSVPSMEDLNAGRFDIYFIVIFATKENKENLRQELFSIAEVDEVDINIPDIPEEEQINAPPPVSAVKKIQSIRIPIERLDKIMNLMGELAIAKINLTQIAQSYKSGPLEKTSFMLSRLISSLQDEIMQTRLLPVAYILDVFPRVARDLAKMQNKEVELNITGGEIELDRVILDEVSEPLVHLVRNAIDHGIETAEERKALNKNPIGKVFINVSRQKGQVFIEVGDDGRGVDFSVVRELALLKGLIPEGEAAGIDKKKIFDLITLPGFSTSDKVTDISGRGVGLDVVKSRIEALGGSMDFDTESNRGSRFILMLPLTLAIIKAMLVKVEEEIFAIPLMNIRETLRLGENELKTLQNIEVFRIRDEVITAIRLNKELNLPVIVPHKKDSNGRIFLVIIEQGKKALGLVVNQVLGEQDIVVKSLGALVKKTKGIAGATILGDGKIALILDAMSLM